MSRLRLLGRLWDGRAAAGRGRALRALSPFGAARGTLFAVLTLSPFSRSLPAISAAVTGSPGASSALSCRPRAAGVTAARWPCAARAAGTRRRGIAALTRADTLAPASAATARNHDAVAIAQLPGAGRNDFIAFGKPAKDLDDVALLRPHLDGAEHRGLTERQEHAAPAAKIDERVCGHHERVLLRVERDADARVHPGLQAIGRVGNLDFNGRRACRLVEHRRDARDAARERFAGEGVHLHAGGVAALELLEILLDDVGDQSHAQNVDRKSTRLNSS